MQKRRRTQKLSLKHVFVAHAGNGRHPHIFRDLTIIAIILALGVVQFGFLSYQFILLKGGPGIATVLPGAIAAMTNEARMSQGTQGLVVSDTLSAAAQQKADDMVRKGYFAHQEPNGAMPWHWFEEAGYEYAYAGENLAVNFSDTRQLVNAWLQSPTHRDNMLKPEYTEIGVGMATGTYKGMEAIFVVQFFGKQKERGIARLSPEPVIPPQKREEPKQVAESKQVIVLGEETTAAENPERKPEQKPVSMAQKIKVSPRTFNTQLLSVLAVALLGVLVLAFTPAFRAHPKAILNGVFVVAAIVFLLVYQNTLLGSPELPEEPYAAAVAQVL